MVKRILGRGLLLIIMIGLFWWITKADTTTKVLFGMPCEVTRIPVSGSAKKNIFTPDQYTGELATLRKKWYKKIDLIKTFTYGDNTIKVLLGEKCDLPVLRINQEESVNDIWVDHVENKGNMLLLYWAKNGYATLISCNIWSLSGNSYKPFDAPKTPNQESSEFTQNEGNNSSIDNTQWSLNQETTLFLEKKFLHPQDAFLLKHQPVSKIITFFGGNWNRDRKLLAQMIHLENYQGTREQNLQIRNYLLSYIHVELQEIETPTLELSFQEYQLAQKKVVSDIAKLRKYTRKYDRWALFQEIGKDIQLYQGTRKQNLEIRQNLLTKIKVKTNN